MTADDPMEVDDDAMDSIPSSSSSRTLVAASVAPTPAKKKEVPLTGTKRFMADLAATKELCKQGYEVRGLQARCALFLSTHNSVKADLQNFRL